MAIGQIGHWSIVGLPIDQNLAICQVLARVRPRVTSGKGLFIDQSLAMGLGQLLRGLGQRPQQRGEHLSKQTVTRPKVAIRYTADAGTADREAA